MQKLLQISAGVFLWIAASGAGHRVCASKRKIKGLRGAERKPRRRCSEGKEKFRLRVCASKRRIKGLRGTERKPRRCCSGKKGKFRLRICASKRRTKGLRGAERKPHRCCSGKKGKSRIRVCASKRRTKGLRGAKRKLRRQEKKPPPSVSEWGKRRRHIRIIQFWVPRKTVAGANVFFMGC